MSESGELAAAVAVRRGAWTAERREQLAFAVATLAAWAHTIDEMRIGELVAVPFGVANLGFVAAWTRVRPLWRAVGAIAFGLLWGLAVIPYHVMPLLAGAATAQHVSGLSRLVGGAAMVAVGIAVLRRDGADSD